MSAIIAFAGRSLDCDAIATVFPRALVSDERRRRKRYRKSKYFDLRSANLLVSRKGLMNLDGQIKDAVEFIGQNKVALKRAMKAKGIEECFISFGCASESSAAAFYYFPTELALLAGELGLGIRLSLFRCSDT